VATKEEILIPWSARIDPATIPDAVILRERARRNGLKPRKGYTGGLYWAKHNPDVAGCRCRECMARRAK
jgi:hypothetical protein